MFGLVMGVGRVSRSITAETIAKLWPSQSDYSLFSPCPGISLAVFTPKKISPHQFIAQSSDNRYLLGLNGYVICNQTVTGIHNHLQILADSFMDNGLEHGFKKMVAGSFDLAVIDIKNQTCRLFADPGGSTPLYYGRSEGGWLLSSNPVALLNSGLIDSAIDTVACAQWALFSHAIGNRYPIKAIRTLRIAEYFSWDGHEGRIGNYDCLWEKLPVDKPPDLQVIVDEFIASCRRIRLLDDNPAQLQSAGMDSRFITASWPDANRPDCYTYGNPEAYEIPLAERIARTKGARWTHVWQHGDEIVPELDTMFNNTGSIIWPDRYFVARKMAEDGHTGTLDGFAGDALLGGSDYHFGRYFGNRHLFNSWTGRFTDYDFERIGLDRVAEFFYEKQLQIPDLDYLREYICDDFIDLLKGTKNEIVSDIRNELNAIKPPNRSLALLARNFIYANRASHMTIKQGLMCNQFIMVYYPFINDFPFHDLAFRLRPEDTAFKKLYIRLYRKYYPQFADIPYGATLIPVRRPYWNHKLAAIMASSDKFIPFLTTSTKGRPRDPNSWPIWMRQSAAMREYIQKALTEGDIINRDKAPVYLNEIADGRRLGGGKIFHLVSLAKWLTQGKKVISIQPRIIQ